MLIRTANLDPLRRDRLRVVLEWPTPEGGSRTLRPPRQRQGTATPQPQLFAPLTVEGTTLKGWVVQHNPDGSPAIGTSFSAYHVAAAAILAWATHPERDQQWVRNVLCETATELPSRYKRFSPSCAKCARCAGPCSGRSGHRHSSRNGSPHTRGAPGGSRPARGTHRCGATAAGRTRDRGQVAECSHRNLRTHQHNERPIGPAPHRPSPRRCPVGFGALVVVAGAHASSDAVERPQHHRRRQAPGTCVTTPNMRR
jgi:hypothetical protein